MVTKMEDRVKVDLAVVSRQILDHVRQCSKDSLPRTPEMINQIGVLFNQGSLVQYHYGEIEKAETLCRGEIELFAHLGSCSAHRALCLANMVPPYINLARIYGQKGRVKESLSILGEVHRFGTRQEDLLIFGHRLPVTEAPAIFAAAPAYEKAMVSCRVIDAARIFQTVEDHPALLQLIDTHKSLPEYQDRFFDQYLSEVQCSVLLAMAQYEAAMEAFAACLGRIPVNSMDRIVIHSLLSQIYREMGQHDLAIKTLNQMEGHLTALEKLGRQSLVLRQIAYRLALERYLLGDAAGALGPAEKAFNLCTRLNDQPGAIRCAILLLRICGDMTGDTYSLNGQRHWYNELRQLASTTFFRLDRASAFWELGLHAGMVNAKEESAQELACEFLQNSYGLYSSIPFVESTQSGKAVKRLLDSLGHKLSVHSTLKIIDSAPIDSAFDALMEYAPKSMTATKLVAAM